MSEHIIRLERLFSDGVVSATRNCIASVIISISLRIHSKAPLSVAILWPFSCEKVTIPSPSSCWMFGGGLVLREIPTQAPSRKDSYIEYIYFINIESQICFF